MAQEKTSVGSRTGRKIALACAIAVIAPFVLVGVPFCIGEHHPLVFVPWSAGDALACCGALSAACVAIYGVYLTLRDNRTAREEQLREASAPCFSAVFLEQRGKRTLADGMLEMVEAESSAEKTEEQAGRSADEVAGARLYREVEGCRVFAIMGDEITYAKRLNDGQLERVKSTFAVEDDANGARLHPCNPVIYVPLKMRNTGSGAASSVRVGVNRKSDDWSGVCSFVLDRGEDFYLGIYVDTSRKGAFGEHEIRIVFSDALGYQYMQTFDLNVVRPGREKSGEGSRVDVAYVGSRRLLDDTERRAYLESVASVASNGGPSEGR